jgi:malate dehydrogenase (oxaloacetate-decarboxylating)
MYKFTEIVDEFGRVLSIETAHAGKYLLAIPEINKGSAFTRKEREEFGLMGKLPGEIETLEQQVARYYAQFKAIDDPLEQNNFLNRIKQHNNTAFYRLAMDHITEMLPILYTPTIGDAVMNYSFQFDLPRGLHFAYTDKGRLHEVMDSISYPEVDLIIITDGEGVLGIGDWGVGGIDICVGKLMVYTLCGGINPRRVLPIQIDVGTNNDTLLQNPMYLGLRKKRVTGADYDDFIDEAVAVIRDKYPNIYLHWEDFGRDNARRNLNRFRDSMCTFNDDMQGTGATTTACMMAGLKSIGADIKDQRIVFLGAGTAGVGIADQMCKLMTEAGLTEAQARQRFWLVDRQGLLFDDMQDLVFFQKPYARARSESASWGVSGTDAVTLPDVVKQVKPTVLVGCSTVRGAFTQEIIQTMAASCERPIIFPLSNPTSKAEASPDDLIEWTQGKAIIATGSPFAAVEYNGELRRIAQCNNAFVFPGLGLGVIAAKAKRVTDSMIAAACHALSDCAPILQDHKLPVLPDFDVIHTVSKKIALAVAKAAFSENVDALGEKRDQIENIIDALFWQPQYVEYTKVDQ